MTQTTEAGVIVFVEDDFARITENHNEIQKFKQFILDRFAVFALAHEKIDVPEIIQQGGGYVTFNVDEYSLFNTGLHDITIYKSTAEDRGGGSMNVAYKLPKVFLFKTSEEETEYAEFLRLKTKLFPKAQ